VVGKPTLRLEDAVEAFKKLLSARVPAVGMIEVQARQRQERRMARVRPAG
jgi:hypothetical protein